MAGRLLAGALVLATVSSGCASAPEAPRPDRSATERNSDFDWQLPAGFPEPAVPEDNPMSTVKVELGRRLFYDTRLSGNGHFSCASCHRQALAFTDGRDRAQGSTGEVHPRSAMTLTNVAYNATYNWADPTITRLERQALNPMFNQTPIELGLAGREVELLSRLDSDAQLARLFERAFPDRGISITTVRLALAAFQRTLISGNSAYDRFVFWDEPLEPAERRGMQLFFSDRTRCSECHSGLNFSGPVRVASDGSTEREPGEPEFHNTGLFDLDGRGGYPEPNRGVYEITRRSRDMGAFRAPTLRNVEVTAPYMHDGSLSSLAEVVDFYAAGGRGRGRSSRRKSALITGFRLSAEEREDLVAFLRALTDHEFLADPRFGPPGGSSVRTRN